MTTKSEVKVNITEIDSGWETQTVDERVFSTLEEAKGFIEEFNNVNTEDDDPNCYKYADLA